MESSDQKKNKPTFRKSRNLWIGVAAAVLLAGVLTFLTWDKLADGVTSDTSNELLRVKWRQTVPGSRPAADGAENLISEVALPTHDLPETALAPPGTSGWESEELSDAASVALKSLVKPMLAPQDDELWSEVVAPVVSKDFTGRTIAQSQSTTTMSDGIFSVSHANASPESESESEKNASTPLSGILGFRTLAEKFVGETNNGTKSRLTFKIEGITMETETFETRVSVELLTRDLLASAAQTNAVWQCRWSKPSASGTPLQLLGIDQIFRERVDHLAKETLFQDCTASTMVGVQSFRDQFLRGNEHWAQRLSILEGTSFLGHNGIAVGDLNGDRLDDLYVCDGGGLPNRLYLQNDDGTLRDVSRQSGVDWLESTASALLVDFDNDGDQDLVLATVAMILFMENDGTAKFTLVGAHEGVAQARSMAAADYDLDGDLDLYICSYAQPNKATGFGTRGVSSSIPLPYNDANNGSPNALLENHGKFRFVDVTTKVGLQKNNTRYSFAASWEDFDLDGDLDLYVANDFGRNCLYRNEGGTFREVAAELGVQDMASGMSVSWGDCNGDGRPDLYVGNMFSAAGRRITYQRKFGKKRGEADLADLQRMARGNSLFLGGAQDAAFNDVSEEAAVTMGRWAWSSLFTDLNNDSRLDLVIANGFLTNRQDNDL